MLKIVKFDENYLSRSWDWLQNDELKKLMDAPEITKQQQLQWYKSLHLRKDYIIVGIETEEPIGVAGL